MIEIENLSKRFHDVQALDAINLSIESGDIFGYIGPNGAGKSTTFKILATLLAPNTGSAIIDGYSVAFQAGEVRKRIGYMPDVFGAYDDMSVNEYLEFFAALYNIPAKQRSTVVSGVLDLTDLRSKQKAEVTTLSRGMQQRLGLARVLLHDPKVLLLDEPASGLDPRARIEIRELLKELRTMGKTILISSHILKELADISTKIGIIERGKILFSGRFDELLKKVQFQSKVIIDVREKAPEALVHLKNLESVEAVELLGQSLEVELKASQKDASDLVSALVDKGFRVTSVREQELDLETSFMLLTQGQVG